MSAHPSCRRYCDDTEQMDRSVRATVAKSGLYLVLAGGAGALERLRAALAAAPAAAVLIKPAAGAGNEAVRALIELAQSKGAAALIDGDARLARTLRADGVHLPWSADLDKRYAEAREILGNRFIVGADAGASRHDAMELGEAGADYVGFDLSGREPDHASHLELIEWWAEIFEVPCVALGVETTEQAQAASKAGADFIGLHLRPALSPAASAELTGTVAAIDASTEDRG